MFCEFSVRSQDFKQPVLCFQRLCCEYVIISVYCCVYAYNVYKAKGVSVAPVLQLTVSQLELLFHALVAVPPQQPSAIIQSQLPVMQQPE